MADETRLEVKITVNAADLDSGSQRARAAIDQIGRSGGMAASQVDQSAARIRASIAGIGQAAETAAPNYRAIIDLNTAGQQSFKSASDSAAVFREALADSGGPLTSGGAALRTFFSEAKRGSAEGAHAMERFGFAGRHVVALFDESMRGARGQMIASASAFLRDSGMMSRAIGALASGWGAAGLAATAFAGTLALLAYRAHQTEAALRHIRNGLVLTGRGSESGSGLSDLHGWMTRLTADYALTNAEAEKIVAAFASVNTMSLRQAEAVSRAATAFAKLTGQDPAKLGETWAHAFAKGGKGAEELAKSLNLPTEAIERLINAHHDTGAVTQAINEITQAISKSGGAAEVARSRYEAYLETLAKTAIPGIGAVPGTIPEVPQPPGYTGTWDRTWRDVGRWFGYGPPAGATAPTGTMTGGAAQMRDWLSAHGYSSGAIAGIMGNASVESSFNPAAGLGTAHQGLFQWDTTRWGNAVKAAGGTPNFDQQMAFMDAELRSLDPAFKNATGSAAEMARRFEAVFERSGGQMLHQRETRAQAYSQSADTNGVARETPQTREARERAAVAARDQYRLDQIEHRHSLNAQLADAQSYNQKLIELGKTGSSEQKEAALNVQRLKAHVDDEETAKTISGLRAQQDASRQIADKIKEQQQIIATLQSRGMGDTTEYRSAQQRLTTLQRQQYDQDTQNLISNLRQKQDLARQISEKIAAQQQMIATLQSRGMANTPEMRGAQQRLTTLQRQQYDEDTQNLIGSLRRKEDAYRDYTNKVKEQEQIIAALQSRGMEGTPELRSAMDRLVSLKRQEVDHEISEASRGAQQQRQIDGYSLQAYERMNEARVAGGQETEQRALALDMQYLDQLHAQERRRLQDMMSDDRRAESEKKDLYIRLLALDEHYEEKKTEMARKAAAEAKKEDQKYAASLRQAFDGIGSSVERAFNSLVTRQTTYAKAMQSLWKGVTDSVLSGIEGIASKAAAGPLASLLGTKAKAGEGVGDVLGNWATSQIGGMFGLGNVSQTTSQVANTTALTANTTALAANTAALGTSAGASAAGAATSASGSIAGGAVSAGGSLFSGGGFLGTIFSGIGSLFAFSGGGIVPAASSGWVVPAASRGFSLPSSFGSDTVLSALTPGETVLPTKYSGVLDRLAGGGGTGDVHVHLGQGGTFFDGASFQKWFWDGGGRRQLMEEIRRQFRTSAPAAGFI